MGCQLFLYHIRLCLKDILVIVLFATLANTWKKIEDFAKSKEEYLKRYLELKNGIPSHNIVQRAMGMVRTKQLQKLHLK
ncbi:MAG: transposase family protein [Lachnospiraceae bacterium]|nr:transposase family protein [Lachnospiraceae bacterium]